MKLFMIYIDLFWHLLLHFSILFIVLKLSSSFLLNLIVILYHFTCFKLLLAAFTYAIKIIYLIMIMIP